MKLSLAAKFNLVFLIVSALGFAATSAVTNYLLQQSAREETLSQARVLMGSASAASWYTAKQVAPLLESRLRFQFVPQSVPAFSATEHLHELLKQYPEYSYKAAMLDPTNPRDRAAAWETPLIHQLRANPKLQELVGERTTPTGPALYVARPIVIRDAACLRCHSTPDVAPQTVLDIYGRVNGFNWKLNEVLGAQVISVPMALPLKQASTMLRSYMLSMLVIFVILFLTLNIMVHLFVTRRLRQMSALADRVSLGETDVEELNISGSDELARLAQSFGRMRTSLASAMKMLEE